MKRPIASTLAILFAWMALPVALPLAPDFVLALVSGLASDLVFGLGRRASI